MRLKSTLRKALMKLTGYWFAKSKYLFAGVDMFRDIERVSKDKIRVIFDVGGNIGQSVQFFKEQYKNATIYSFEPVKSTFQNLAKYTKSYKNIHLENKALGESVTRMQIKLYDNIESRSSMNSLDAELMNHELNAPVEEVALTTVDDYVKEQSIDHIDLLKLDVEKWEIPVLKGAEKSMKQGKIKFILSEVGFETSGTRFTNFNELSVYLKALNYSFVGLYEVRLYNNKAHFGNALFVYEPIDPKSADVR